MGYRQETAALKVVLPQAPKHVLQVLAFRACEICGRAWPGVPSLAADTGLGQRAVRSALEVLRRRPELVTVFRYPRGGRGVSTEYVVMPSLARVSPDECGRCSNRTDTLHQQQGIERRGRGNPARSDTKTLHGAQDQQEVEPQQEGSRCSPTGPDGPGVEPHTPGPPHLDPDLPTPPSLPSEAAPYVQAVLTRLQRQRGRTAQR